MSSGLIPITPSTLVVHECRGLKKRDNETGERRLLIERLPDDDPSGLAWQVTVFHPPRVNHSEGSVGRPFSIQEPEIVHRGNDEAQAKRVYHGYAKILGGAAPDSFDPKPEPREDSKRIASLERELDELRAIVLELAPTKKK